MGDQPNNNVDLGSQAAQQQKMMQQQQQMWQAEQQAVNQAATVDQQLANQDANQAKTLSTLQQQQFDAQNAGQGMGNNATGGASGIKAANTILTNSAGLSPADQKLQAAGLALDPNSLQSLAAKKAQGSSGINPSRGLLSSSNIKLGGS